MQFLRIRKKIQTMIRFHSQITAYASAIRWKTRGRGPHLHLHLPLFKFYSRDTAESITLLHHSICTTQNASRQDSSQQAEEEKAQEDRISSPIIYSSLIKSVTPFRSHYQLPEFPLSGHSFYRSVCNRLSTVARFLRMVVAAGSKSKFNRRRANDPAHLVITDDSNGDLSGTNSSGFSSMADVAERDTSCVSCTTFNILAPIYKRLDPQNQRLRESDFRSLWLARNQRILDWLLYESSSIMCLQEFWVGNEELVQMYEERLGNAGYLLLKLARTNNRGDGLLTAIRKEYLRVVNYRELLFNDFGDRVAQLIHVESVAPSSQSQKGSFHQEFLIVNTHLLFPHDSSLSVVRLHQVYQILQNVELYQRENKLKPMPIILCGDWNGSKRGHVYKFLRSQGFLSSYDIAHQYTDSDADCHKWVSHRNHRGNICGVDFIWLCNPNKARKPLKTSWAEALFSIIKYQFRKASLSEDDAFAFLKGDNCDDFVTFCSFSDALRQVKLIGVPHGLCFQELKDLWAEADIDGSGVLDFEKFKKIWNCTWSDNMLENLNNGSLEDGDTDSSEEAIGFKVKNAVLFPHEVEKGLWPDDYSLSDHACLTVGFLPTRMWCSGLQNRM